MAIDKVEFRGLLNWARITEGKDRTWTEHNEICDRIYADGSAQQKGALTRMLRQRFDDRTADTGGMDI